MKPKLTMGEKLKDLRTERGLTTREVCRLTGVSENIYNGLQVCSKIILDSPLHP